MQSAKHLCLSLKNKQKNETKRTHQRMFICTLEIKVQWQKSKEKERKNSQRRDKELTKTVKNNVGDVWSLTIRSMAQDLLLPQAGQPRADLLAISNTQLSSPFETFRQGSLPRKTHIVACTGILHTVLRGQESAHIVQLNIHNTMFFLAVGEGVLLLCKICFIVSLCDTKFN